MFHRLWSFQIRVLFIKTVAFRAPSDRALKLLDVSEHKGVLVDDYDEALRWYTEKLGLELRMDGAMGEGYRFVTVGVKGQRVEIVLHKPFGDKHASELIASGESAPGVVFSSDSCRRDTEDLRANGVTIKQGPEDVPWGVQTVLEDLYGNTHVIVQPAVGD